MANATDIQGRTIHITLDGATNWSWNSSTEIAAAPELTELSRLGNIFLESIEFNPSAPDDKIVVRQGSLTGGKIFDVSCADAYDQKIQYYSGESFPGLFIAASEVTSSSSATLTIIMR